MIEKDPVRIANIQRRLRHKYMALVGISALAYIIVSVLGGIWAHEIGPAADIAAYDEYFDFIIFAFLPGFWAIFAFVVCIPTGDTKKLSGKQRDTIKTAQTANAVLQSSVGNMTGAANSLSGAMGGTDGVFLGPRTRFVAPLFVIGALSVLMAFTLGEQHNIPIWREWLFTALIILGEVFGIAAAVACRVYNRFKDYRTTDRKEADEEYKRISALQEEQYRKACEELRERKKHKKRPAQQPADVDSQGNGGQ